MSLVTVDSPTRAPSTTNLSHLLHNSLLLNHIVPYLSASSILSLASSCRDFRAIVQHTPGVFRHLDLTTLKAAQFDIDPIDNGGEVWRNVQLDENLTEDEYVSLMCLTPFLGAFFLFLYCANSRLTASTLALFAVSFLLWHDVIFSKMSKLSSWTVFR